MASQNMPNKTNPESEKPITRPISRDFDIRTYQSDSPEKKRSRDSSKNAREKNYSDKNIDKNKESESDFYDDETVQRGGMDDDAER
jgi:hypothetical protein